MKADPKKIPVQGSDPEVWIQWHQALKSNFGKATANQLFLRAWQIRGQSKDDSNLRSYLKENGITLTTGVLGKTEDFTSGVFDSIGDALSLGKGIGTGIVVIGAGLTFLLIYNLIKDPLKTASAASRLR